MPAGFTMSWETANSPKRKKKRKEKKEIWKSRLACDFFKSSAGGGWHGSAEWTMVQDIAL
jgi:hypothetical protein